MHVSIEKEILNKYPGVEVGFLVAQVSITKNDPFIDDLKLSLAKHLQDLGIHATNFAIHPSISLWREIYEKDFHVKAKTYRSSIEALLRRVVMGKEIWNICNVVDLYNCCSIISLLPMGGYDLNKVSGSVQIRYASDGESFLGLGEKNPVITKPREVVYADEKRVICWLWNHKDSEETCIDEHSKYVLFFIDSFEHSRTKTALMQLSECLEKIGCKPLESGILNRESPQVALTSYLGRCPCF